MIVKANAGLKVPREDKPREYIDETTPVEVPDSAYYLRRVADGDLVMADEAALKKPVAKAQA